jgi:hypothetical protein
MRAMIAHLWECSDSCGPSTDGTASASGPRDRLYSPGQSPRKETHAAPGRGQAFFKWHGLSASLSRRARSARLECWRPRTPCPHRCPLENEGRKCIVVSIKVRRALGVERLLTKISSARVLHLTEARILQIRLWCE